MTKPRIRLSTAPMMDTSHAAASYDDPALRGWNPLPGSADADLIGDLDTIRPRSHDLARNNGYVAGAGQTFRDQIVGSQLRIAVDPDRRLLGWDRPTARAWIKDVEPKFGAWANDPNAVDAGRSQTLLGLTLQAIGGWFSDGDVFAVPHYFKRDGTAWNTHIQIIDAARVSTPAELSHRQDIRGGVQIDKYGSPIAYYIRKTHPGDGYGMGMLAPSSEYQRIPAFTAWGRRRVIHLHEKERTGQSRGKPLVSSIMREIRMASHYTRTELQSTIVNSLISAFLKSELGQEQAAGMFSSGEDYNEFWKEAVGEWRPTLKAGAVIPLPPTASIESFQPSRPNSSFEPFMESVLRNVATGINIPYELLAKDFSKTNYSSARAALLEAWRYFQGRRTWIQQLWLGPLYELWLEEAVNTGVVVAPDYYDNRYAYRRCSWIMSGRGWVDPLKEADAAGKRLDMNITTLRDECAEQGKDYEEVLEQRAEELEMMANLGISDVPMPGQDEEATA